MGWGCGPGGSHLHCVPTRHLPCISSPAPAPDTPPAPSPPPLSPPSPCAEEASTRIDSIISQSQDLAGRLAALDHAVSMDRAYLNKTELRAQRGGGRGGGDEGGFADVDSFKPL